MKWKLLPRVQGLGVIYELWSRLGDYYRGIKGDTRSLEYGSYSNVGLMIWGLGG